MSQGQECACLGARERSERVTGRRQPPCQRSCRLVSKTSTRFTANCPIWTVLRGAFEAIFRGRNVIRFSVRFGDSIMRFGGDARLRFDVRQNWLKTCAL